MLWCGGRRLRAAGHVEDFHIGGLAVKAEDLHQACGGVGMEDETECARLDDALGVGLRLDEVGGEGGVGDEVYLAGALGATVAPVVEGVAGVGYGADGYAGASGVGASTPDGAHILLVDIEREGVFGRSGPLRHRVASPAVAAEEDGADTIANAIQGVASADNVVMLRHQTEKKAGYSCCQWRIAAQYSYLKMA